ncbi:MAG: rod shape-determining protein MreC [Patescibacteria group bacterium]
MNYVLKSSIKERRSSWPLKGAGILAVLLVIFHFVFPRALPIFFTTLVAPFWSVEKNVRGDAELVHPLTENALMRQLQSENISLKEILGRKGEKTLTLGYILKKPPFSAYDIFILDIGTREGVEKGNPVYALGNILIGEVADSLKSTSKVKLYSSFGEKFDVFIGPKSLSASALGRGGGSFEAELPRDSEVREGDSVAIPAISGGTFGVVTKVLADPARPFATILFSQPFNLYEQKWVQVETGVIQETPTATTTNEE